MKFLKKLVNRGAPKGVPFLLLLMVIGVLAAARARPAEAAGNGLKAYSWGSRKSFQNYLKNGSDENGIKLSKYGAKFNFSNPKLKIEGRTKPIDLSERCTSKADSPYRYWFWVKGNKMRTSQTGWHTEYFVATRKPLAPSKNTDGHGPALDIGFTV